VNIGETLARARRDAALSIAEISSRTRLRLSVVYDIEHDDYSACGGDHQARDNITAIARALGVDSGPLIEAYDAARRPAGWITATRSSEPALAAETHETLTPRREPEPFTPQDPEPFTPWQEPEPFAAQDPEPFTLRQEPELFTPQQEPEPATADDDTQPITTGERSEPITTGEPAPALTIAEPPYAITPVEAVFPAGPSFPAGPAKPFRLTSADWRPSIWIALGGALLLVAVLGGILLIVGASGQATPHTVVAGPHRGTSHPARTQPPPGHSARSHRPTPQTSPAHGRPVRTLSPASIKAFGPGGAGQGDSPQLAHLALAGKAAAPWHSAWYTTSRFGNLQPGTGLLLDMGRPVTVTSAQIALGNGRGADIALRIGNSPALASLSPIAHATGAGGVVRLTTAPTRGRYVLIWFTRLPRDQAGTFQVSVYDIKLRGRQ
jgi:hypothetical protein